MTILEKMRKSHKKYINLYFKDGDIWENRKCTAFFQSEDEDEENMLDIEYTYLINESEIEDIEILGDIE